MYRSCHISIVLQVRQASHVSLGRQRMTCIDKTELKMVITMATATGKKLLVV